MHSLANGCTSAHFSDGNGKMDFRKRSETFVALYLANFTAARSKEHGLEVLRQLKLKLEGFVLFIRMS